MFTGLVERTASVVNNGQGAISLNVGKDYSVNMGDSVAVNGVCLTVTSILSNNGVITFDVSHETIDVTNLKNLKSGDLVNVERPMAADGRFHGHIVSGHIDTVGKISKIEKQNSMFDLYIEHDPSFQKWVAPKGSIAIDGISLTVNDCKDGLLRLTIIPHTIEKTVLKDKKAGSLVNIEFDILAKYIENLIDKSGQEKVGQGKKDDTVTENFLRSMGYGG